MESEVAKQLMSYGALGILTLLSAWWALRKDREARASEKQVQTLLERYVTKSETWMEQYHSLARELKTLVQAIRGNDAS